MLAQGHRLIAESIRAHAQTQRAERRARFFETRQTLFETIVDDRTKAQSVIEYQERCIAELNCRFEAINADRDEAQIVMVLRKAVFDDLGGFDENLPNNFNDVDFCLRLRERGWQVIWTPYADLIHHESASRGQISGPAGRAQLSREAAYMNAVSADEVARAVLSILAK